MRGVHARIVWIGLAVAAEYHSTLPLRDVWRLPAPVYATLPASSDIVLLELPLVAPDVSLEPIYMYFSTFRWHQLVNGYSGFSPPSYQDLLGLMADFPSDDTMAEIRRRGVDYLIVHGALFRSPRDHERLVSALDRRADVHLEGVTRWQARDTRVYRVIK